MNGFSGPLWLIDVERSCLRSACPGDTYVALSYVWGRRPRDQLLETKQANLQELCQPEAFLEARKADCIPQEILAAMHITKSIGQRNLWCDRFCIIQDESDTKSAQISNMASIYAHAFLTIVCTEDSYSGGGIYGLRGFSEPKASHYWYSDLENLTDEEEIVAVEKQEHHSRLLQESTWDRRGWTLQEKVFSQRAIFFHRHTVTWECHCAIWHEGETPPQSIPPECKSDHETSLSKSSRGLRYSPWPNLDQYARLVVDYSYRDLTFKEDIMRAFAGITNTLAATFLGGFHFGLPRLFFDTALLWLPDPENIMERRCKDSNQNPFPSWSWVGWKGTINLNIWRGACDYAPGQVITRRERVVLRHTVPTVQWHIRDIDGGTSAQETLAQGDHLQLDNIPTAAASSIPKTHGSKAQSSLQKRTIEAQVHPNHTGQIGVSLQRMIDPNISLGEQAGPSIHNSKWRRISSHWKHPCNQNIEFKYPIPIVSDFDNSYISKISFSAALNGSPYLTGKTSTAQFWCRAPSFSSKEYTIAAIYDSDKLQEIGELTSNDDRLGSSERFDAQDTLTFVAVSEGYSPLVPKDNPQYRSEWKPHFRDTRYVNVLWVEQVGNISYRRGVGRILKDIWYRRAIATDVILG